MKKKKIGHLMCTQKFKTLCGKPVQISYQHKTIYSAGSWEWTHDAFIFGF